MKAILIFKLPDEKYEFHQANEGWKYSETLREILDKFRDLYNIGQRENIPVEEARQIIIDICNDNQVNLDEL